LTLDEQKAIAMNVCFFFISVVLGSFGLLYVYHRIKTSQQTKRESFFEFIAGELQKSYPYPNTQARRRTADIAVELQPDLSI